MQLFKINNSKSFFLFLEKKKYIKHIYKAYSHTRAMDAVCSSESVNSIFQTSVSSIL